MYKVIVFDAFNTVIKRNKKYTVEPYKIVKERGTKKLESPMTLSFNLEEYAQEIGASFDKDEWSDLKEKLKIELSHIVEINNSKTIMKALKEKGMIIVIGSNLAPEYGPTVKEIFADLVDDYYFSYEMGLTKPSTNFYDKIDREIRKKYDLNTQDVFIMVGDSLINDCQGPNEYGWKGLHLNPSGKNFTLNSISKLNSIFLEIN